MRDILPCPFCGGSNVYLRDDNPHHVWIECDDCQIGTLGNDLAIEPLSVVVNAWNRRSGRDVARAIEDADHYKEAMCTYKEQRDLLWNVLSGILAAEYRDRLEPDENDDPVALACSAAREAVGRLPNDPTAPWLGIKVETP